MKRVVVTLIALFAGSALTLSGQDGSGPANKPCENLTLELKLPKSMGKRKNPVRVKAEDVDAVFLALEEGIQGHVCRLRFNQVFEVKQKEKEVVFFPITQRVLRAVPEASLQGLALFNSEGASLGAFDSRIAYEKSGDNYKMQVVKLYSIQFKNAAGEFESSGREFLGENYLLRWDDLKDKVALISE